MKTKLSFEYEEYVDAELAKSHLDGPKWKNAVWEIDMHLRNKLKYESVGMHQDVYNAYQSVRDFIRTYLDEAGLTLEN